MAPVHADPEPIIKKLACAVVISRDERMHNAQWVARCLLGGAAGLLEDLHHPLEPSLGQSMQHASPCKPKANDFNAGAIRHAA
jgi:hypothetical protein